MDLNALKSEVQSDPTTLGFAAHVSAGSHHRIAEILNTRVVGIQVRRTDITSQELVEAILVTDYTALPGSPTAAQLSAERRYLSWLGGLFAVGQVRLQNDNGTDTPVIANLLAMFPVGSSTRTRLIALATRNGSRAEQLWGRGTAVTADQVTEALALQ